jgi:dihydropteroate synthase
MTGDRFIWRCRERRVECGERTLIMGIVNVTPDSFSDGGQFFETEAAVSHALELAVAGADLIDVGGESTRPGAERVSPEEEQRRVVPIIRRLRELCAIPISIDTYKSAVAHEALHAGADIINDISGLTFDPEMAGLAAQTGAGLVLMHIQGTPTDMQLNPHYQDVMEEILRFLQQQLRFAAEKGVKPEQIVVDPGIGFGKRLDDNFTILRRLRMLQACGVPILVGPSRKSFIGQTLDAPANDRLEGTSAAVTAAILNGANIVRVHDVKEMKRVARIADAIKYNQN